MTKKGKQKSFDGGPVGYGKPPADHQFKKGGKKPEGSGRKRGSRNYHTIIAKMLDEEVSVTLGGKLMNISKRELLVRAGYDKAIKGRSVNDLAVVVRLFEKLAPQSMDPPPPLIVRSIPGDEGL